MKILILILFLSPSFAGFNWLYAEKIAAETNCRDRFFQNIPRSSACILGVTAYGDARGWQGINTTRNQALSGCQNICNGTGVLFPFCSNGCTFAKTVDQ
ncbi:MAG: hypothetical protein ACHQYQ_11345 [Bacteriovoracales bacterium]